MTRDPARRGAQQARTGWSRALVVLLALGLAVALVVGLVAGLVAVADRWWTPAPALTQPVCTAEVADPDDGVPLRASFAPDQTANAALVVGLAHRRGLPARAATIGVATAVQESSLRNLDYGDRDSLGLFQQRPSQGWGTAEQLQDPLYAAGAFYDALVAIDGYEALTVTDAAQQVQRSGFPDAYADHESEGRALASSLYGLSPASLVCELPPVEQGAAATGSGDAQAAALVDDLTAFGPSGWQRVDEPVAVPSPADEPGAVVVLDATQAEDPARTSWALAHTAVALAADRDVVAVAVDGRVWDRDAPDSGWTVSTGPGSPASGQVRVTLG